MCKNTGAKTWGRKTPAGPGTAMNGRGRTRPNYLCNFLVKGMYFVFLASASEFSLFFLVNVTNCRVPKWQSPQMAESPKCRARLAKAKVTFAGWWVHHTTPDLTAALSQLSSLFDSSVHTPRTLSPVLLSIQHFGDMVHPPTPPSLRWCTPPRAGPAV